MMSGGEPARARAFLTRALRYRKAVLRAIRAHKILAGLTAVGLSLIHISEPTRPY